MEGGDRDVRAQRPGMRAGAMAAWRACWEAWSAAALACVLGRGAWRLLVGGACPRRAGRKSWAATCWAEALGGELCSGVLGDGCELCGCVLGDVCVLGDGELGHG
jgi:hypothetical protein